MKNKNLSSALRNNLLRRKESQSKYNMDNNIEKKEKLYEGKAKILFTTDNNDILIQFFKDDATAFNNLKKDVIERKGILNNYICEHIMLAIKKNNIPTHFIRRINDREQLVRRVSIIPLEVIVRNIAAGSMAKRLGIEEGRELIAPVFEICYKNDELQDPLINEDHAVNVLGLLKTSELQKIKEYALLINDILKEIFISANIKLIDFKIEFGFDEKNEIILADEISPDSCRLWEVGTHNKLDKDRFRRDMGGLVEAYSEVAKRLGIKFN